MIDKNIKHIIDKELEYIYVTEELKKETLQKCKRNKACFKNTLIFNKGFKAVALVCTLLFMFVFSYFLSYHSLNKGQKNYSVKDNGKGQEKKSIENKVEYNIEKHISKDELKGKEIAKGEKTAKDIEIKPQKRDEKKLKRDNVSVDINTEKKENIKESAVKIPDIKESEEAEGTENTKNISADNNEKLMMSRAMKKEPIEEKIKQAEEFWNGEVPLPSYIPEGYKMEGIDTYAKEGTKFINITYKKEKSYFKVEGIKGEHKELTITNLENPIKGEEKAKEVKINKEGVSYILKGDVKDDILQKIAESID